MGWGIGPLRTFQACNVTLSTNINSEKLLSNGNHNSFVIQWLKTEKPS